MTDTAVHARDLPDLSERAAARIDAAIDTVRAGVDRWAGLTDHERADLLDQVHRATAEVADSWTTTACEIKGIDPTGPYAGEEWMSGPYATLSGLGAVRHSLLRLADGHSPATGAKLAPAPGGRTAVRVLPSTLQEFVLLNGFRADVWTTPGVSADQVRERAGLDLRRGYPDRGVGVVLGAGNITSIAPLDVIYELVAYGRPSVLKLNPILADLMTVLSQALWPLIRKGYLRIVQGGAAEGEYLTSHPGIDHVHITGSAATHDAIVWGTGEQGEQRKASGEPKLRVPITSELGGVSPVIVVPGEWSNADLRFQAENIATMRLHNSGHNCIAAQVVLLSADWPQRDEFLAALRQALAAAPARGPWYPGADARISDAARRPGAQALGSDRVLVQVSSADEQEWVEGTEVFAAVLGVVDVPGTGSDFLSNAVAHANDRLAGTLGANVIVDPTTRRGLSDFEEQLAQLRYGTIGVNVWTGFGFLTAGASWGGFPGADLREVASGIGVVHNARLIDDVERTVVRGPFRPFPRSVLHGEWSLFPKPPWFVTARTAAATGRSLARYAARESWSRMPAVFVDAFRG